MLRDAKEHVNREMSRRLEENPRFPDRDIAVQRKERHKTPGIRRDRLKF